MTETILRFLTRLSEAGDDAILSGELAAPFFGPVFDRLLAQSRLWDSNILPAERPRTTPSIATWRLANTGIGLPIDHALVSAGIGIVSRRVGPDIGSDHHPLILDLKIAP